jgi:hypothetical protein
VEGRLSGQASTGPADAAEHLELPSATLLPVAAARRSWRSRGTTWAPSGLLPAPSLQLAEAGRLDLPELAQPPGAALAAPPLEALLAALLAEAGLCSVARLAGLLGLLLLLPAAAPLLLAEAGLLLLLLLLLPGSGPALAAPEPGPPPPVPPPPRAEAGRRLAAPHAGRSTAASTQVVRLPFAAGLCHTPKPALMTQCSSSAVGVGGCVALETVP